MTERGRTLVLAGAIVAVMTALDQITKHAVATRFALHWRRTVIPGFFDLVHVHNTGAAFGMGRNFSAGFFIAVTIAAIGLVGWMVWRLGARERAALWGLSLILSGAVGNLIDRLRFGYVVDFVEWYVGQYRWPAFNVADAAITVGAVIYALGALRRRKPDGSVA